ncbi:MarR family transcriptional regulator [Shewanella psychropiezotolerans]|uniref:MarR family transcriptional regulator n=1 Tax=Shewanella psychropiezotolerans TaxID=2593655 RepID=A0ABX5WVC6_9GAMM|nr:MULTISPECIES: MarR family transcriptional regulator [Shewanella]MPY25080.1 MarR family transcriptional regulator [Shewanella sp. YLB-07]QDO82322.1 MarR family transcriptional regulator [Shewanella psychropiezotolerans]
MDGLDRVVAQWGAEKPHLDTLPMELIGRLMRLSKHIESQVTECHKAYDLKPGEFDVIATLRRSGGEYCLTPSELIDSMMLTSGAMTNRLSRLESKGLIERVNSKEDRRSVSVALTQQGVVLIDEAIEDHGRLQQAIVESLSESARLELNGLLKTWLAQYES